MDRIEVGYTPAAFVGGLGITHKYILYTKDVGLPTQQQFYVRGGPGYFGPGAEDGGLSESSSSPFGNIKTREGEYVKGTPDWDAARDPGNPDPTATPHPRETIIEGDDLSFDWQNIRDVMGDIDNRNIGYDPKDANSNASVDEALRRSGLPTPIKDGPSDNWAPGSDFDIPGGDVAPGGKSFGEELGDWMRDKLGLDDLLDDIADLFNRAKNWTWPRDPILLDLDGDGLETVGLASNVHFDHDGDGVLTKTGWAGRDDALLVWDRNTNGSIDTGAELFGDFTPLPNGTLAPNGFAALAALDSNGDGILDASDPQFAELKLWRDADQNGVTGAGELISLADVGITSLNIANTLKNQRLANGNTLAREGSFTRADGSTGGMGEFHFATDTFSTRFAEEVVVPEELQSLPNMGGAGNVRDLQQAAAQSGDVAGLLAQFQNVWVELRLKLYRQIQSPSRTVRKTLGATPGDEKNRGRNHVSHAHTARRRGTGGQAEACVVAGAWFVWRTWQANCANGLNGFRPRWARRNGGVFPGRRLQERSGAGLESCPTHLSWFAIGLFKENR